jgi:hypothetical protein
MIKDDYGEIDASREILQRSYGIADNPRMPKPKKLARQQSNAATPRPKLGYKG